MQQIGLIEGVLIAFIFALLGWAVFGTALAGLLE